MQPLKTILILLFVSGALSAQRSKKIQGNGKIVTVERSTGDYDHITASGFFDIELVPGKEGNLILEGEENILKHIITKVEGNKLIIKLEKGYQLNLSSHNKGISITVPIEVISSLTCSGSGDITGRKTIKTDRFETTMSGSGDVSLNIDARSVTANMSGSGNLTLNGRTTDLSIKISGSGDVEAYGLTAENVEAVVSGSANIEVTATQMIDARVSGSGDIDYRGNPGKVITKVSGSGDVSGN